MKLINILFGWAAVIATITLTGSSPRALAVDEAQAHSNAWENIGGDHLAGWTGPMITNGIAELPQAPEADFRYPQGPKGWYSHGFRIEHDGTRDWRTCCGLQVEVNVGTGDPVTLKCDLLTPPPSVRQEYPPRLRSEIQVQSVSDNAWQWVNIPWSRFGLDERQHATLEFIQEVRLSSSARLQIRNIRLTRPFGLALESPVRGRALPAGGEARYDVTVFNPGTSATNVHLGLSNSPWESMLVSVVPSDLLIGPGASASCSATVNVPSTGIPPGGHESQTLTASASDLQPATLELVTAREICGPSILHTDAEWAAIRDHVKHYDWARVDQADFLRDADKWTVPQAAWPPDNFSNAEKHVYTFANADFAQVQTAAVAWQLTRDKRYAEKVAEFLRRLSDEKFDYPSTFAGTNMGSPQEGENFQCVAVAYDAIRDAEVLTEVDQAQMLATPAENSGTSQWVNYKVAGDDKPLAQGESGIWIIGSANVDVPIRSVNQLAFSVLTTGGKKKSLFWNAPRFEMGGGKEVPVTSVTGTTNVDAPAVAGQDYYNGPVTIDGNLATNPLATQPENENAAAELHIAVPDGAVRFKATLGGDYPLGDRREGRTLFADPGMSR